MSPNYVQMFLFFGISYYLVFGIGKDFDFMLWIVTDTDLCKAVDFKKDLTHQHFHCVITIRVFSESIIIQKVKFMHLQYAAVDLCLGHTP